MTVGEHPGSVYKFLLSAIFTPKRLRAACPDHSPMSLIAGEPGWSYSGNTGKTFYLIDKSKLSIE